MTHQLIARNHRLAKGGKKKGFTLIELIVVIAILAILAAIAIPAFLGQLENARNRTHNANVKILRSAAAVYLAENGAPAAAVAWNSGSFDSDYIEEWPTNPINGGAAYTVAIATTGAVTVLPAAVT